jgi:hypothetical protein
MRYPNATKIEGKDPPAEMEIEGPIVAPGNYQVTLSIGEQRYTQAFAIIKQPGVAATSDDLQAQFDTLMRFHHKINQTIGAINRMRDLRGQLDGWATRAASLPNGKPIADAARQLKDKVLEIEKTLLIPDLRPGWADNLNQGVRLLDKLLQLPSVVELGDYRPTDAAHAVFAHLSEQIDAKIDQFNQLAETELAQLNAHIAEAQIGAVVLRRDEG